MRRRTHREETAISTRRRTVLSGTPRRPVTAGLRGFLADLRPACSSRPTASNWLTAGSSRPPRRLGADGATVSRADYAAPGWHTVRRMPATVLEALQDDGTYPDLYYGKNLLDEVPQDLYKQDWWYRTTFTAPAGHTTYLLELPGINYRAEVWLNGHLVADSTQIVGMYDAHELDVARWIAAGRSRTPSPSRSRRSGPCRTSTGSSSPTVGGTGSTGSTWATRVPDKNPDRGNSFVSDRNAGIWKPVYLQGRGRVALGPAVVNTELPLPRTDSARLTIHTSVHNYSTEQVRGVLKGDHQPRPASRASTSSSR